MPLQYDPEYWATVGPLLEKAPPKPDFKTAQELRAFLDNVIGTSLRLLPTPDTVSEEIFFVKSYDGVQINLHRFTPRAVLAQAGPQPAIMHMHGGGMLGGSVEVVKPGVARNAAAANISIFSVGYRLAPENPAPAAVEDCYAALKYIHDHAEGLNIDPSRIAVMGESGGGCLAAGVCLMARDRGLSPPVAKQILIYPMLDDRTLIPADDPLHQFLTWNAAENKLAWAALLGDKAGDKDADVSPYVAPARAESLAGLPPTYIDIGGLDLFREESMQYAARIGREGGEVEFHLWPGLPHGFEGAFGVTWVTRAMASRIQVMRSF